MNKYNSPGFAHIRLADPVLEKRLDVCIKSTIPAAVSKTIETNRINAFDIKNYHGERHIYWDSDVAKVLEGIANALTIQPDEKLLSVLTDWIDKIVDCQQEDGYLNSYFSGENASDRWKNLRSWHELYCAGHLMEAAVAAKDLPGGKKLLDAMCRYADCICDVFGPGENQRRGWPGHEEIELALIRLYQADHSNKAHGVGKIAIMQVKARMTFEMVDAFTLFSGGSTYDTVNIVAFFKKKFAEV